jgi:hypothetical protein
MTLLACLILFSPAAHAAEIYRYESQGKIIAMPTEIVKGARVNDLCAKDSKNCQALKVYRGRGKMQGFAGAKQGGFLGAYCERVGGTTLLAHAGEEAGTPFCLFDDLTAIDAGQLYRRHFGGRP